MLFTVEDIENFKSKALQFADDFDVCCLLDSNNYVDPYSKFDFIIAIGYRDKIECKVAGDSFYQLQNFKSHHDGWIFGGFAYDLKNELEKLSSENADYIQFPELFFFSPLHLLILKGNELEIISSNAQVIFNKINRIALYFENIKLKINPISRFKKSEYIDTVKLIKEEIALGNIYETNFCIEFYEQDIYIDPKSVYYSLNKTSPTPFSNYFKWFDKYIISATPERFLSRRGKKLISQPIKGTAKRGSEVKEDEAIKANLKNHPKEQQENVMIVDLVRNDLTKSAKKGTVKVEELFGIYSFKHVHQMISTVICEVKPGLTNIEIIKNSFPMGSMTGAPKIKAMQLIDKFERSKRGIYSGAIGYFSPEGDFDFNVVIRTILYNASTKYLSFQVGSALTYYAEPEKEYEECLLKLKAILQVLS